MEEYRKVLVLPLKEKWYRMIESGIKTEEYRELTPYWCNRILYDCPLGIDGYWGDSTTNPNERGVLIKTIEFNKDHPYVTLHHLLIENYGTRGYTHVEFTLGYPKKGDTSRRMLKEIVSIKVGKGNPEWGAPEDKEVFIINLK
jgi:hypothetical protein